MLPTCGHLPQVALGQIAIATDSEQVCDVCNMYEGYGMVFDTFDRDTNGMVTLEDRFLMLESKKNAKSFLQQFHFGIYYFFIKPKQLECYNILSISECIAQRQTDKVKYYIPISLDY